MAELSTHNGDLNVTGHLSSGTMTIPGNTLRDAGVASDADIQTSKMRHRYVLEHKQQPTTNITTQTDDVHIVRSANGGTALAVEAAITSVAATGDRTVTIDVHKGNASTAFATILSSTISFSNADAVRTVKVGTITTTSLADGDVLRISITAAGSTGVVPQGLAVCLAIEERA